MRLISRFLFLLPLIFLTGCVSSTPEVYVFNPSHALTEEETEAIITHIRRFVEKGKYRKNDPKSESYKGFRLSPAERRFIRNAPPKFKVHYTGRKSGELLVRWDFPNHRSFIVKKTGYLLSTVGHDWNIRLITDKATGTIPKNYFGANKENIQIITPEMRKALQALPPASPKR